MSMMCKTCLWWQKIALNEPHVCCCVDSDNRFDITDEQYSCGHWENKYGEKDNEERQA